MSGYARRSVVLLAVIWMSMGSDSASAQRISLDGEWMFVADTARQGEAARWYEPGTDRSGWRVVTTPDFWEAYPGLASYDGWGWYARTFRVEGDTLALSVHFAGVDDDAEVWINGVFAGSHTGYSDPFTVDISRGVRRGENTIVVLVKDYAGGGGIYRPVTVIPTSRIEDVLRGPHAATPARPSADWVRDGAIYSVYLRSFSREGTFEGLRKRLPELRSLGVTTLWLMPIHPVGEKNRKGTLGSPYAVRDFYAVNPEFGTMKDLRALVQSTHDAGMKLIIDLVANHTSWDSRLLKEHPEWFTKDSRGRMVAPNEDWTDVADLDYSHRGLRDYMMTMMVWWVREVGIDGFRCDVAEMVPTDFWEEARRQLDAVKPVMMLSEGSLPEHHLSAFDLTYAWNVYDALDPLLSEKRPVAVLDQILRNEELQFPRGSLRMRFTTNHDKNAWDAPAVKKFGPDGLRLATVLVNMLPGVPLIYTGEEVANDRRLSLFEKVGVDWKRPRDLGDIYGRLFALRNENPAVARGEFLRLSGNEESGVYAFLRQHGSRRVLVLLNFGSRLVEGAVSLPPLSGMGSTTAVKYSELFTGTSFTLAGGGGEVPYQLGPKGYRVFVVH
jgi:glycosidase